MSHPRPRFQPRPKTRVISPAEFGEGFWVYANSKRMHVGYIRVATISDGSILVEDPQWEDAPR